MAMFLVGPLLLPTTVVVDVLISCRYANADKGDQRSGHGWGRGLMIVVLGAFAGGACLLLSPLLSVIDGLIGRVLMLALFGLLAFLPAAPNITAIYFVGPI